MGEIAGNEGYRVKPDAMTGPDGVRVAIDRTDPVATLARLVQEDMLIPDGEYGARFPLPKRAMH